nr:O-antigen ligase family protein [Daejeonella sp. JGW-45]
MIYSGTRGAYVLFPAAMVLLAVLIFNKKVLILTALGAIVIFVLISIPTSNQTLYRFQSAFKPSEDASFSVRANNQKMIQPYIQSHPMGGGLGSTGVWGAKFSPGSFLASFPPDSGYVRVAVELGWVGLLLFCTLMFIILKTGINNYYLIKDLELKSYCLAMTLIVFALNIGNYPQEALVQFPTNVYFYLVVALINITLRLDLEKRKQTNEQA